jgi:hypothetical protein
MTSGNLQREQADSLRLFAEQIEVEHIASGGQPSGYFIALMAQARRAATELDSRYSGPWDTKASPRKG